MFEIFESDFEFVFVGEFGGVVYYLNFEKWDDRYDEGMWGCLKDEEDYVKSWGWRRREWCVWRKIVEGVCKWFFLDVGNGCGVCVDRNVLWCRCSGYICVMMEGWKEKKVEWVVVDEEGELGCCLIWLLEGKKGGV